MLAFGCERESTPVDAPGVGGEDRQLGSGPAGDRERERERQDCNILSVSSSQSPLIVPECRSQSALQ